MSQSPSDLPINARLLQAYDDMAAVTLLVSGIRNEIWEDLPFNLFPLAAETFFGWHLELFDIIETLYADMQRFGDELERWIGERYLDAEMAEAMSRMSPS